MIIDKSIGTAAPEHASVHHSGVTPPLRSSPGTPRASSGAPTVRISDQVRGAVPIANAGHRVELSEIERTIMAKVDGRRAVRDVALMVSLSLVEVAAMFVDLAGRGVVRLEGMPAQDRRSTSGVRPRPSQPGVTTLTLDDDDIEELEIEELAVEELAHVIPTVAGQMPAITAEQAQRMAQVRPTLPTIPRPDTKR